MRSFFKGWRRKIGCATLVLACALFVAWMRTTVLYEFASFGMNGRQHWVLAIGGTVSWMSLDVDNAPIRQWFSIDPSTGRLDGFIETWAVMRARPDCTEWTVSLWSVVVILTLLSAFLILWKPRTRAAP